MTITACALALGLTRPAQAQVNTKQCTAQIKAKNTSPNHKIKIDKLSTAAGPIYVYGARSPSKPHRVLDNTGDYETWTIELDTQWVDNEGTGCKEDHRVKVDLIRDGHKCEDVKFPYTSGKPSDPKDAFVNPSKGDAVFQIGGLQKAYDDCLSDTKCDCDGPQNK